MTAQPPHIVAIALVDDHRVVTRSLQAYLESFPDFRIVGSSRTGEALLDQLDAWKPDVVLQDLLMPGGIDGIETTRRILARLPHVRIVALTASTDEARMMAVLRAGALGYVRKDADPEVLVAAVRAVGRGRTYIDPSVGRLLIGREQAGEILTPRETDVLRKIAIGRSNKQIAAELAISEETVKTHVAHLLAKLGVENRAQATAQALKRGLVSLDDLG
jgi:NarL family two-component system response regulator LiaR